MTTSAIPPRWKRLLYSIVSAILGVVITLFAFSLQQSPHASLRGIGMGALFFGILAFLPSLCGWIVALPFVLLVTNFRHWRFLVFWAIGTAIGPLVILAYLIFLYVSSPHAGRFIFPSQPAWVATAIACLTTILYLLLVVYDQHRSRLRAARNTP